ncbi:MAG: hypothetical protein MI725_15940, partial [Pirellulales bacterium]|nr:hypothetical protein [Pirellulales bacterium]
MNSSPRNLSPLLLLVFGISLTGAHGVSAQDPHELKATYGRGVHAYFAGQLKQAEQHFSQVIASGSRDPRVYYFRAMTLLGTRRQFEAENDMRTGAAIEARNPSSRYSISRSLQRVQGHRRKTLEKFRRQARLEREQLIRKQTRNRYEQLQRRGDVVLHREEPVELDSLVDPLGEAAAPQKGVSFPVVEPPLPKTTDSAAAEAEEDPFGQATEATTDENPFDFGESTESAEPEEATEEEPLDDDFFGASPMNLSEEADLLEQEDSSRIAAEVPPSDFPPAAAPPGGLTSERLFFELGRWLS